VPADPAASMGRLVEKGFQIDTIQLIKQLTFCNFYNKLENNIISLRFHFSGCPDYFAS